MKTLVYMIRHGESLGNQQKRFLGHTDLSLTEKGRAQAQAAAAYVKANGILSDAVYASPLSRALETARIATGTDPVLCDDLREIYAGAWEGLLFSEIAERYPEDVALWNDDIGVSRPTGGESVGELSERVLGSLFAIAAAHEGKTVFIGTHATPVRVTETYARGLSVAEASRVAWPSNASLSAYLVGDGEILPLFYSLDSYLDGLVTVFPNRM